jgi:polyphosphate kinase
VFNYITGYAEPSDIEKMAVSPLTLRKRIIEHIRGETNHASTASRRDLDEDELAGRPRHHRRAV